MDQPRSRQELYEMIRNSSREEFILNEMKRLGFWNTEGGLPKLSEELIKKKGAANREMQDLLKKKRIWQNKEKLLKEMRKKRMAEAKARRTETKAKRERIRAEKAEAWKQKQENDIIYLGEGVSAGLNEKESDKNKLKALGLPVYSDVKELASSMNLTLGKIRYLSYHRKVSKTSHYKRFRIKKKTGGERIISAPMLHLKNAQHWILENVLYKINVDENAHGFVPQRSILTNAEKHVGNEFLVNIDLKDFFPSLNFKRVKGLFVAMGYSEQIATIFSLMCTEPEMDEVELDGENYFVARGERILPQGAPTSPAITNLVCHRLDKRMKGLAKKFGFTYSRYADDMTFSKAAADEDGFKKLMWAVRQIVKDENFTIHPDKVHIMRKGSRREVTGIVVNEKLSVSRKKLKNFRAVLHKIEKTRSLDGINWGKGSPMNAIFGFANFVRMVDPEKGNVLMDKVKELFSDEEIQKSAQKYVRIKEVEKEVLQAEDQISENVSTEAGAADTDSGDWWSVW